MVHAIQAVFFKFTAPPFLGGLPGSMRIVHPKLMTSLAFSECLFFFFAL